MDAPGRDRDDPALDRDAFCRKVGLDPARPFILYVCSALFEGSPNEAAFAEIVYEAAVDAQAHVTVVEKRMQGRDHPVLLGVPETYYLKCFILRKLA